MALESTCESMTTAWIERMHIGAIALTKAIGAKKAISETRVTTNEEKIVLLDPIAQAVLTKLVPLISVFARHAPHQKEAVLAAFNHGGFRTLMVGDGTNDVGALKRAHVGISIISAPQVESKLGQSNLILPICDHRFAGLVSDF